MANGNKYEFKQSGFGWILGIAVVGILGVILWILFTARDTFNQGVSGLESGAVGKTVANNVTGLVGGLAGGVKKGVQSIWGSIKNFFGFGSNGTTPTATGPTDDQATGTLGD